MYVFFFIHRAGIGSTKKRRNYTKSADTYEMNCDISERKTESVFCEKLIAGLSFCDSSTSIRSELHLRVYLVKRNCCIITTVQKENDCTVRSSVFWNFTQCRFVLSCRRFGRTYRSHHEGSSFNCLTLHDVTDMLSRNVGS